MDLEKCGDGWYNEAISVDKVLWPSSLWGLDISILGLYIISAHSFALSVQSCGEHARDDLAGME